MIVRTIGSASQSLWVEEAKHENETGNPSNTEAGTGNLWGSLVS